VCSYSWRVPLSTGSDELRIVAAEELGDLGPSEGAAVSFQWRWYYPAPSVGLWALLVFLLILVKRTHTARAWLILIAVVLAIILWQMEGLSPLFVSLGAAAIIVWLVGGAHPTYRARHRGESIDSQALS
jgi:lipopolysaccharide export LptBFGC system permease protein LptF